MFTYRKSNPVKVLHVIGDSRFGGAGRIILGLGQVAQAEGWDVDILTTDPVFQQAVRQHGLGLANWDVVRRKIRPLWDLVGLVRLRNLMRREHYDIVHTHTSKGGFVGRLAARLAHVPVIVHTAHGFAFHERSPRSTSLFYSALERIASRWCDRIVSVSEFHRRWALELGICKPPEITAIPNGIAALPNPALPRAESRRQLGVTDRDMVILSMARLAPDKGLEYLITAATLLLRTERQFRIVIAGDGPLRARLEALTRNLGVADWVNFLGFREDVSDLLSACDLVVLPSLREGLSIALLEAMAAGKPIIATSIGSHRELACQAEIAHLVPPADATALCEAILQVWEDPALRTRLGATARNLFESHYTEQRMLKSYKQLYFDLARAKGLVSRLVSTGEQASPGRCGLVSRIFEPKVELMKRRYPTNGHLGGIARVRTHLVRQATAEDLPRIITVHQKAFSNFFLTRLGNEFLRRYYALVLDYRAGVVLVSEHGGVLEGFVCGFVEPPEFYRLMWCNKRTFALPVLSALVRHPSLATGMLHGVQRVQSSASKGPARSCELSSIAVAPEAGGNGLGRALVQAFVAWASSMDAQCVYLTTDAEGNEPANTLYRQVGFQHRQRFLQRKGRWMNEYVIDGLGAVDSTRCVHE